MGALIETNMEAGMKNFMRSGYKGVTETWNVLQHEVKYCNGGMDMFYSIMCRIVMIECKCSQALGKYCNGGIYMFSSMR